MPGHVLYSLFLMVFGDEGRPLDLVNDPFMNMIPDPALALSYECTFWLMHISFSSEKGRPWPWCVNLQFPEARRASLPWSWQQVTTSPVPLLSFQFARSS